MPKFTIECTFNLSVFRHTTYEAETAEAAMSLAINDEDWNGGKEDYDSPGPHRVTGIWEGEDSAYMGKPVVFPDQVAEITVFVVTTCIPDRGEGPCFPDVFGTEAEAVAYLEDMLKMEWALHGPTDEETGKCLPYPGDWSDAQDALVAEFDGEWGQWQLTSHKIGVPA